MNDEAKQTSAEPAAADTAQLIAAIVLALGGIVAFYVLQEPPGSLGELGRRWPAASLLGVAGVRVVAYGRNFWQFVLESRVELRKVFWPTAQETFMTTLVVLVFVVVASVFFWLLDLIAGFGDEVLHRAREAEDRHGIRWYVVHAYSNFEHRVSESLKERIKRDGLEHKFGEILVPTEEVVEMRDGQRRKSERKFYPGYVLVQMDMDEQTWHLVRDVPKVLGFIGGTPDKPAPITEKEANQILRRVEEGVDKPRPKVLFEPGEVVRVTNGPFNDFNGVVENVNYEKSRLQVAVQILGRSTPVELDFSQVEKA